MADTPPKDLGQTRSTYIQSFRKFYSEANRTYQLLMLVKKFPASLEERQSIIEQRQLETAAYDDYCSARAKRFDAVSGSTRIRF